MRYLSMIALAASIGIGASGLCSAAEMTPKEMSDARAKVQTAVALVNIAKETKDPDAMLVAARLIATSGNVAMPGETGASPKMYDAKELAAQAKAMGADATKADAISTQATSSVSGASPSYWINTCDYSGYCAWAWID